MVRVESPFPEAAIPRVWSWIQEFRYRVADDFAPDTIEQFVEFWANHTVETWGVWRDGELGGLVVITPVSPVLVESHCLFKRTFWGHDTTLEALRQVYTQVFARGGIEKIFSVAFRDNAQLLGLARKLGAQKEGVLRRHTRRLGEMVDMIAIGLLKEEFERATAPVEEAAA